MSQMVSENKTTGNVVSWRKKWNRPLMNASFFLFWAAFPCAYSATMQGRQEVVVATFCLLLLACGAALVTKK